MHRNLVDAPPLAMDEDSVEAGRLGALERFDVMDTPREEAFDRITRLIRNIFDLPIAIVSMIDGHRQWYKAYEGLENREVGRDETFCKYTLQDLTPLVVPDARQDLRFAQNPACHRQSAHPFLCRRSAAHRRRPRHRNGVRHRL